MVSAWLAGARRTPSSSCTMRRGPDALQVTEEFHDAAAGGAGAVIPVLPVTDTLKTADASGVSPARPAA